MDEGNSGHLSTADVFVLALQIPPLSVNTLTHANAETMLSPRAPPGWLAKPPPLLILYAVFPLFPFHLSHPLFLFLRLHLFLHPLCLLTPFPSLSPPVSSSLGPSFHPLLFRFTSFFSLYSASFSFLPFRCPLNYFFPQSLGFYLLPSPRLPSYLALALPFLFTFHFHPFFSRLYSPLSSHSLIFSSIPRPALLFLFCLCLSVCCWLAVSNLSVISLIHHSHQSETCRATTLHGSLLHSP